MQKSQAQSRTSGNGGTRRKTRVMSDDEDMIMDETNQVCLSPSPLSVIPYWSLSSHPMAVVMMTMKVLVGLVHVKNDDHAFLS